MGKAHRDGRAKGFPAGPSKAGKAKGAAGVAKAGKAKGAAGAAGPSKAGKRPSRNPNGRPARYGVAFVRRPIRWPDRLDVAALAYAARTGQTHSLLVRRAVLAYLLAEDGPSLVRAFVDDLIESARLVELAATDPRTAARQVFDK